VKVLVKQFV